MTTELGKLVKVPLREVWALEAAHFSVWLADNIDQLADALDLELGAAEREVAIGRYSCDIVAQDLSNGTKVIIENQLEPTNHTHLGQLVTYASGIDAGVVIWISPDFREEHRSALDWLNSHTGEAKQFFGIQIEAWQIDSSRPAPVFKVVASPNGWQKGVSGGGRRGIESQRTRFFIEFFSALAIELRAADFTRVGKPGGYAWLIADRVRDNVYLSIAFSRTRLTVELAIESANALLNQDVFKALNEDREEIEGKLGLPLVWSFDESRRRQTIWTFREDVDRLSEASLEAARIWSVEAARRMKTVFEPYLKAAFDKAQVQQ
jgi:hypothetical protein